MCILFHFIINLIIIIIITFNPQDLDRVNANDQIDYGQIKRTNIGDLVEETLCVLEVTGGEEAFSFIKAFVPTYQSCVMRCKVK